MKSAHFHAISALQCKFVVFGRFLGGSGFRLQLVTLGNGWLILIITRDDSGRREEVFLWKKILLEGCCLAGRGIA